jgi:glycosyltransferase involved in cell wall biosynthesis
VRRAHRTQAEPDLPPGARVVTTRLWPHGVAAILTYPWLARRARADLTLTHNFTPLFGRSAVFVHDVMFQTNPEWFTRAERAYFALIPMMLPRADVVLTSSATEARRIERRNPRVREVHPVGLAVGTALATADPVRPDGVAPGERFVLSVGRLNVRKNLAFTFEAALRSGTLTPQRPLLVVGQPQGRGVELEPAVREATERGEIRFLGRIGDGELAWLYRHADLFVYLSLDEGFGLPPIEALTFGCPVLVSDIAVFRENLADQATYVDPHDVDAAARALARAATEPPARVTDPVLPDWAGCVARLASAIRVSLPQLA